jgi:hypothetical protein
VIAESSAFAESPAGLSLVNAERFSVFSTARLLPHQSSEMLKSERIPGAQDTPPSGSSAGCAPSFFRN